MNPLLELFKGYVLMLGCHDAIVSAVKINSNIVENLLVTITKYCQNSHFDLMDA